MRILHLAYLHPAIAPGGAQQVAYDLFRASRAAGHDAALICALDARHAADHGRPGAPIVPLAGEEAQYLFFPQHYDHAHLSNTDDRALRVFGEFVRHFAPDVVQFHHYHRTGVEAIRAARRAAPDAVITLTLHEMMAICLADGQMLKRPSRDLCVAAGPVQCHGCFPEVRPEFFTLRARRLQAMLADCDGFVFPSRFLAERYADWGLPATRCSVVPNGSVRRAVGPDRDRHSPQVNRFGFFGQLLDNKGLDVILDALLLLAREGRVPHGGILLEINGGNRHYASEAYLDSVATRMREIAALDVGPIEIRDRGAYTHDALPARMAAVDWVIVPSTWWEVFGLTVSEAWTFGRPVVVSAIAGLDERVTDGVDGLKVPARDPVALADVMAALPGDAALWRRLNAGLPDVSSEAEMFDAYAALWRSLRRRPEPMPAAMSRAPARPAASPHAERGPARFLPELPGLRASP